MFDFQGLQRRINDLRPPCDKVLSTEFDKGPQGSTLPIDLGKNTAFRIFFLFHKRTIFCPKKEPFAGNKIFLFNGTIEPLAMKEAMIVLCF